MSKPDKVRVKIAPGHAVLPEAMRDTAIGKLVKKTLKAKGVGVTWYRVVDRTPKK